MTALLLIALALAAPAPNASIPNGAAPGEACANPRAKHAFEGGKPGVHRGKPPTGRRLDELPPGSLELAVGRHVDNCAVRAIVRTGYGRR